MEKTVLKKFGEKVKKERLKQKLSQEDLAKKAGVHRTYIGMIERAEKNITLINVEKVAGGLGIEVSEIFKDL